MKTKLFASLLLLTLASSCSTIRMRYDARVKNEQGKVSAYRYEKSYDVGSFPVLCALTGIFFGGACWYYTVMPTTGQQLVVEQDAKTKLDDLAAPKKFEILSSTSDSTGWKDEPESFDLEGHKKN